MTGVPADATSAIAAGNSRTEIMGLVPCEGGATRLFWQARKCTSSRLVWYGAVWAQYGGFS